MCCRKGEVLKRRAIIDLCDMVIEADLQSLAASADRQNAFDRCREIVDLNEDGDAAQLLRRMAQRAAALVASKREMIDRLAHRLDEVGELTGDEVDAVLLGG
jgi:hypothetical protein